MESYLANKLVFRKLLLFQLVGKAFLFIPNFYLVVRRYVVVGSGAREVDKGSDEPKLEDEQFASETRSLLYLYGESNLNKSYKQCFSEFHEFTVDSGLQVAPILATNREVCYRCNKTLTIEGKPRVVISHIFLELISVPVLQKAVRNARYTSTMDFGLKTENENSMNIVWSLIFYCPQRRRHLICPC